MSFFYIDICENSVYSKKIITCFLKESYRCKTREFNRRGRPTYFTQRAHFECFDLQSSFHFSDCSGFAIVDEQDDENYDEYGGDNYECDDEMYAIAGQALFTVHSHTAQGEG